MKAKSKSYKAFVSSTFKDLKDHRARVIGVLRRMGIVVDPMEDWTADSDEPKDFSQARLEDCDLCVLLVAFRRGYIPDGETTSITQLEYEAAVKEGMDVLVFLLDEEAAWPRKFDEFEKDGALKAWRDHLVKKHGVEFFSTEPSSIDVSGALGRWLAKKNGNQPNTIQRIDWPDGKSPYPGLEWFDEDYAPLYFGRDREVGDLMAKLSDPQGRFLIISGASGSGKSSLVAAGLWQALIKEGRLPGSHQWRWLRITPSADSRGPFVSLAAGLKRVLKMTMREEELGTALATAPSAFTRLVTPQLLAGQELVLVIDQLEELFTQGYPSEEIQTFLNHLMAVSQESQNRCRVVTTIRSEFFGRLAETEAVLQCINAGFHHLVGPIAPTVLLEMIQKPALVTGYTFEQGLIDTILDDAGKEPGNLPLVAYTLKQLFEHRKDHTFTLAAYQAMGGVLGAIGTKADEVLATVEEEARHAFDRVFAELVHLDRARPPTRKRAPVDVFHQDPGATQLIEHLAGQDCRILVTGVDAEEPTVEVAHEQLFTAWPQLHQWIRNSEEGLRLIDHATEEARRWHDRGNMPEELWLASRANEVVTALHRFGKAASPELDRFLHPQKVLIQQLNQKGLSHKQRAIIGWKLAQYGDPRPGVGLGEDGLPDIAWVEILGGRIPLVLVRGVFEVKPFRLAKYPVTNIQFQAFIDDKGYDTGDWWEGITKRKPELPKWSEANGPRETVSWDEAVAFCRWLSARLGKSVRLPTEWEWQQAATGGNPDYAYPWGTEWDSTRGNSKEARVDRTCSAGLYPNGATKQGALDMAGNVWEWCLTKYDRPEKPESLHVDKSEHKRVIRGGSWLNEPELLRSSNRVRLATGTRDNRIGFRLAQDIP